MIDKEIGWNKIDAVAGGETAGIPFAAFLAALAKKSMVYVRKQPKGFGRMAQIEGDLKSGKRVLLVEDLATDGGSKLVFIEALKRAEAKVTDCFVIFHYGIFPQSIEMLAPPASGCTRSRPGGMPWRRRRSTSTSTSAASARPRPSWKRPSSGPRRTAAARPRRADAGAVGKPQKKCCHPEAAARDLRPRERSLLSSG